MQQPPSKDVNKFNNEVYIYEVPINCMWADPRECWNYGVSCVHVHNKYVQVSRILIDRAAAVQEYRWPQMQNFRNIRVHDLPGTCTCITSSKQVSKAAE